MDWGEDDGESGAEEEQESSSPAPSGFTCRNSRALAADPSSLPRLTYPRGDTPRAVVSPHPLPGVPRPANPWSPAAPRSALPKELGGPP